MIKSQNRSKWLRVRDSGCDAFACRLLLLALLGRIEVPVSDSAVLGPKRGSLCSLAVRPSDLNFGRLGSFNVGPQHPHVPNLDPLFLQVTADLIVGGILLQSIHRELPVVTRWGRNASEATAFVRSDDGLLLFFPVILSFPLGFNPSQISGRIREGGGWWNNGRKKRRRRRGS